MTVQLLLTVLLAIGFQLEAESKIKVPFLEKYIEYECIIKK